MSTGAAHMEHVWCRWFASKTLSKRLGTKRIMPCFNVQSERDDVKAVNRIGTQILVVWNADHHGLTGFTKITIRPFWRYTVAQRSSSGKFHMMLISGLGADPLVQAIHCSHPTGHTIGFARFNVIGQSVSGQRF